MYASFITTCKRWEFFSMYLYLQLNLPSHFEWGWERSLLQWRSWWWVWRALFFFSFVFSLLFFSFLVLSLFLVCLKAVCPLGLACERWEHVKRCGITFNAHRASPSFFVSPLFQYFSHLLFTHFSSDHARRASLQGEGMGGPWENSQRHV